jgi:very-short-patch-repair endonuclease
MEGFDAVLSGLAAAQHGVVDRRAALAAGVTADAIRHRVRAGRLHVLFPGVYAVGHPAVAPLGRAMAAVLACGPGAALSHQSAAHLHGLLPRYLAPIHVSRVGGPRQLHGVVVHRPRALPPSDVLLQSAVPVTTPARTILDLADTPDLQQALNEAQVRRIIDLDDLRARARGRLRELLEDPQISRSELERALLTLIRRAGLPHPETNVYVEGHEVDTYWPAHRLIAEVDGFAYHRTRKAFEQDRHRDQTLTAAGYTVIRLTWRQITTEPERAAATLATVLTRCS